MCDDAIKDTDPWWQFRKKIIQFNANCPSKNKGRIWTKITYVKREIIVHDFYIDTYVFSRCIRMQNGVFLKKCKKHCPNSTIASSKLYYIVVT